MVLITAKYTAPSPVRVRIVQQEVAIVDFYLPAARQPSLFMRQLSPHLVFAREASSIRLEFFGGIQLHGFEMREVFPPPMTHVPMVDSERASWEEWMAAVDKLLAEADQPGE